MIMRPHGRTKFSAVQKTGQGRDCPWVFPKRAGLTQKCADVIASGLYDEQSGNFAGHIY